LLDDIFHILAEAAPAARVNDELDHPERWVLSCSATRRETRYTYWNPETRVDEATAPKGTQTKGIGRGQTSAQSTARTVMIWMTVLVLPKNVAGKSFIPVMRMMTSATRSMKTSREITMKDRASGMWTRAREEGAAGR